MAQSRKNWPEWWDWELDCSSPHLAKRMIDRSFSETDLRQMLEQASGFRPDRNPGRWVIETAWAGRPREIILEPIDAEQVLLIVTAFVVG
jgi:hypothetical protein